MNQPKINFIKFLDKLPLFLKAPHGSRRTSLTGLSVWDKAQKGFTLIEVSIFIVLVGLFLAAVISPFLTSVLGSEQPRLVADAMFLAAERLEQLQPLSYSDSSLSIGTHNDGTITLNGNTFTRTYVVSYVNQNLAGMGTDQGYKKVIVTITQAQLPTAGIAVTSLFTDYAG